jgi:hypothetical protein
MATLQAFAPAYGQGQAVSVSGTAELIGVDELAQNLRIANFNNITVFVRVSTTGTPAVIGEDFAVGPNSSSVITKPNGAGQVSLIASGTGTVYVQPGVGVWD